MHELSVCQALISQVERIARENRAERVTRITVAMGPLSGVEQSLLENAYPIARAGTIADDAGLVVESMPVRVKCTVCGGESDALPHKLVCGHCGDWKTDLVSGDELLLVSVELDRPDAPAKEHVH